MRNSWRGRAGFPDMLGAGLRAERELRSACDQPPPMKPSLDRPCFSRRAQRVALWLSVCLPFYVLSTGPVAWATNDAFHPAYLPEGTESDLSAAGPAGEDRVDWSAPLLVDGDSLAGFSRWLHHALKLTSASGALPTMDSERWGRGVGSDRVSRLASPPGLRRIPHPSPD